MCLTKYGMNWPQVKFMVSLLTSSQTPTAAQQKFVIHSRSCSHRGARNFFTCSTVLVLLQVVFHYYTSTYCTVWFTYSGAVSGQLLSSLINQSLLFPPSSLAGFTVTFLCCHTPLEHELGFNIVYNMGSKTKMAAD